MRKFMLAAAVAALGISAQSAGADTRAAQALIDTLGLNESVTPSREHPRWAPPERVAVALPGFILSAVPELLPRLERASGDASVTLVKSFRPSSEALADADVLLGVCPAGLPADSGLRWIHSFAVGVERCLPGLAAMSPPPLLTNGQKLTGPNIAEHAIAMVMALSTNLHRYHAQQLERLWRPALDGVGVKRELAGQTMLVAGLGGIGTEIARRANALGMRVIATRNSRREGPSFVDYVGLSGELFSLAGQADVIVNALPLTAKTENLFDAEFFTSVRAGALYISVGRGKSTDHDALVAALRDGRLRGAGLDVTEPEPLPAEHPLWGLPNVIITPHASGWPTAEALQRIAIVLEENLRRYTRGEPLLNVVDIERGY